MPALVAVLWGAFYAMIGSLVGRVLASLGMGFVSYTGINFMLNQIKQLVISQFAGAGSVILGVLYTAKLDVCISIIFSAVLIRFTLAGMSAANGTMKQIKVK